MDVTTASVESGPEKPLLLDQLETVSLAPDYCEEDQETLNKLRKLYHEKPAAFMELYSKESRQWGMTQSRYFKAQEARAVMMKKEKGSLKEGKKKDEGTEKALEVFRGLMGKWKEESER